MIATIIILSILLISSIYIIITLYTKVSNYENYIEKVNDIENDTIKLIKNLLSKFMLAHNKIVRIDRLGSFEADDEVGFIYKIIKETVEELRLQLLEIINVVDGEEKEVNDENKG